MLRARMTRSLCTMLPQLLLQAQPWKSPVFWLMLGLKSSQTGGLSHLSQLPCQSAMNHTQSILAKVKLLCGAVAGGFEDLLDILLSARTSVLKNWNCDAGHRYIMCLAIASGNIRMIELLLYHGESLHRAVTYPTLKDTGGVGIPMKVPLQ
ncbi:unnamed protein product [Penicillium nalgiovense]|nr:unnamed protein product [Penicillium nalgiovense]